MSTLSQKSLVLALLCRGWFREAVEQNGDGEHQMELFMQLGYGTPYSGLFLLTSQVTSRRSLFGRHLEGRMV